MEEPQSKLQAFFSQENFEKIKARCAAIIKRIFSCFMSLETFTFAFSIFNIVIVTLASIISMVLLVYFGTDAERIMSHIRNDIEPNNDYSYWEHRLYIMFALTSWILVAVSLISVVFAVVLIQGIKKRKPGYLKAYLIYGVVVNIVVFLASVITWLITAGYRYHPFDMNVILYNMGFTLWFVYTCVLIAIQQTYQKFRNEVDQEKVIIDTKAQLAPFSWFSLESGTLGFAIFNMVVTSLVSIATAVGFLYWIIGMIEDKTKRIYYQFSEIPEFSIYAHCMIYLVLLTFALISLAFAGLLLYGILKRNAELLKVYFIYGVVVEVLSLLGTMVFLQLASNSENIQIAVACLIICVIYTGMLFDIYRTYRKFEANYNYHDDHQKLVKTAEIS